MPVRSHLTASARATRRAAPSALPEWDRVMSPTASSQVPAGMMPGAPSVWFWRCVLGFVRRGGSLRTSALYSNVLFDDRTVCVVCILLDVCL